jgi:MFS transporter, FSR family, fosmidomycin resistance protein
MLYAQFGYSLVSIGTVVSLYNLAGAFSGMLSGVLADRIGYKPIYYVSSVLSTPSLLLFLYPAAGTVYVAAFFAGFFIMATLPLAMAMAQELAPKGKSMISSLMMGLAVGIGGMMAPITGKLADLYSIQVVLRLLAFLPIVMIVMITFLPEIKRSKSSVR